MRCLVFSWWLVLVAEWLAGPSGSYACEPDPNLKRYQFASQQMGTNFTLTFYASDEATANRASELAFARVAALNDVFSDYDGSSESRQLVERVDTQGGAVEVSDELWTVLGVSLELSERSGGAFDVTVGPLTQLWRRARRRKELPSPEAIARARQAVGWQAVQMVRDGGKRRVALARPGMRLDFGAIAKGYAADEALRVLRDAGCGRALVDAGGDLVLGDPPPGRAGWTVSVSPLAEPGTANWTCELARCGVATSGDAWQFVELQGERYSHILDPRTGWPLRERMGVTVVAESGMVADGLASAVCVLGAKAGLEFVDEMPGAAAVLLTVDENGVDVAKSGRFDALGARSQE